MFYLNYLAWGAFKAKYVSLESESNNYNNKNKIIKKGLMMNLSNPKIIIFFLAFLPKFTAKNGNTTPIPLQLLYPSSFKLPLCWLRLFTPVT
ncbi:LysE family transporter [Xenorhabdus koppenhoeferi]|uniref:LysE family transporter n=1 Tax=Xenorhabdus koppenhoeferi TaxID=351659 RepID=UPI0015A5C7F8